MCLLRSIFELLGMRSITPTKKVICFELRIVKIIQCQNIQYRMIQHSIVYCCVITIDDVFVVHRKQNKCTHNTNERNYTKRHQDIYVVQKDEYFPIILERLSTNHFPILSDYITNNQSVISEHFPIILQRLAPITSLSDSHQSLPYHIISDYKDSDQYVTQCDTKLSQIPISNSA